MQITWGRKADRIHSAAALLSETGVAAHARTRGFRVLSACNALVVDPIVLGGSLRGHSAGGIFVEQIGKELLAFIRDKIPFGAFELDRAALHFLDELHEVIVVERGIPDEHDVQDNAERPQVHLWTVRLP